MHVLSTLYSRTNNYPSVSKKQIIDMNNTSKQSISIIILLFQALLPIKVLAQTPDKYDQMYDRCLQNSGTINNSVVYACSSQVSSAINKEMNDLYNTIYRKISTRNTQDAQQFASSHQSWKEYRDNHCELMGSYVGSPMYSFCPMQLNKERIAEMRELAR